MVHGNKTTPPARQLPAFFSKGFHSNVYRFTFWANIATVKFTRNNRGKAGFAMTKVRVYSLKDRNRARQGRNFLEVLKHKCGAYIYVCLHVLQLQQLHFVLACLYLGLEVMKVSVITDRQHCSLPHFWLCHSDWNSWRFSNHDDYLNGWLWLRFVVYSRNFPVESPFTGAS